MSAAIPDLHVLVRFGKGVPAMVQARGMMAFEKVLVDLSGKTIEVFKESKGDDSKLRSLMTPDQRARL